MTDTVDPSKIVSFATRLVDQIGDGAAEEIEKIAAELEAEAKDKADALRRFAAGFRQSTRTAAADIAKHCVKASDIYQSIEALQSRLAKDIHLDDLKRLAAVAHQDLNGGTSDADSN